MKKKDFQCTGETKIQSVDCFGVLQEGREARQKPCCL